MIFSQGINLKQTTTETKVPFLYFLLWLVLFNVLIFCGFIPIVIVALGPRLLRRRWRGRTSPFCRVRRALQGASLALDGLSVRHGRPLQDWSALSLSPARSCTARLA